MNWLKKLNPWRIASWFSVGDLLAGDRFGSGGEHSLDAIDDLALRDPAVGDDEDAVELARLGDESLCCGSGVNRTNDAPPGESALPNFAIPAILTICGPPLTSTWIESPTLYPVSSALRLSITTSSSARGGATRDEVEAVQLVDVAPVGADDRWPIDGVADGVAVLVDDLRVAEDLAFSDARRRRPSRRCRRATRRPARAGRTKLFGSSKDALARTTASVPSYTSENRSSNVFWIVSVSTSVPAMNATPSITASAVAMSRNLCATRLRSVVRSIGQSPNFFIRSRTRSAVGCCISSTILPSARKTMRSA